MIRAIVIFTLLGVVFASPSANQYVDNVIQTALPNELLSLGMNPAPLPSFGLRFGPGIYQAEADFINGNAAGFASVFRKGECQGPKLFHGDLTINCTLILYALTTNYGMRMINGSHFLGNARNTARIGETYVDVIISGEPPNYVGSVKSFRIEMLGVVNPTFSALPPSVTKYTNDLRKAFIPNVSTHLYNVLQQGFAYALGRALASRPMPRQ